MKFVNLGDNMKITDESVLGACNIFKLFPESITALNLVSE